MAIKIHHGPNGAYKTSGAIQDDAIPAILAGRVIITNIRGFTLDRVLQEFPDAPKTLDVINLSMESSEDLEKMRCWFMWAPRAAFLIFDETQILFPKSWRERDLEQFDFPGGLEAAKEADRPTCWLDAWTRHRHWNWDIVLTTPNIRYIRDEIRLTCEKAYLHANLGLLGPAVKLLLRSDYKEAMHDAQENRPGTDGTIVEFKKIKPATFRIYDSTATGVVTDTTAGKSLLGSPKVLGLLVFIAGLVAYLVAGDGLRIFTCGINCKPEQTAAAATALPAQSLPPAPGSVAAQPVSRPQADGLPELDHPFKGRTFEVRGTLSGYHNEKGKDVVVFDLVDEAGLSFRQTSAQLKALGYRVVIRNECYVELQRDAWRGTALCAGVDLKAQAEALANAETIAPPSKEPRQTAQQAFEAGATRVTVVEDTSRNEKPFSN
ncbi:hypothetical protein F3I62_16745 [Pseudomonas sp. R-28-1W-6]|uniref:zonular occludens toxin domain-containing protein n=1 Tax=Pseudomonas sp. R-28-1W-6 TaxID=2650101 RepID=UPI0013652586|nr:zonular occludens toxin domain-containing protein [Pseudomonas sp. R-28-1W-6]MWV13750.1 hypothetical protein [Pseudomonas sp. R-28-1W-6]